MIRLMNHEMRMVIHLLEIQETKGEGFGGGIIAQLNSLISFLNRFLIQFNCGMLRSRLRIISHIVLNLFLMLAVFPF